MHKYYVLLSGSGEIEKYGPYATDEERDAAAKEIWSEANQEQQTIHWLNVDRGNADEPVQIGDYSNGDLESE
jgi:hypothetical protein